MKKLISLAMAVFMLLSLATVAFADQTPAGSIEIKNAVPGNVYSIYKLLDLETYDNTQDAFQYTVNPAWEGFFVDVPSDDPNHKDALDYVSLTEINGKKYVTWIAANDEVTAGNFAKLALQYAQDPNHKIQPLKVSDQEGEFVNNTFSGLELGYYLVDSSMGALCGLTTTHPKGEVEAKNAAPTVDKYAKEDGSGAWETLSNTAGVGETVEFRVLITVHAGAQNFVFHDQMDAGLTLIEDSISMEHIIDGIGTPVPSTYYTVVYGNATTCEDAENKKLCDFEIVFTEEFCNHLGDTDTVAVYYSAVLNENALIDPNGNDNKAYLTFGDNHTSNEDITTTKTYSADIVKTDSNSKLLDGAIFKLYNTETDTNPIYFVKTSATDIVTYRPAVKDNEDNYEAGATDEIDVEGGIVRLEGLDAGAFYLEEYQNPAGYNKLDGRQKFTITNSNLTAKVTNGVHEKDGVKVVNQKGNKLPETGAMGRTIFISFGMVVMIGTGLLLVTKKRMSMIED